VTFGGAILAKHFRRDGGIRDIFLSGCPFFCRKGFSSMNFYPQERIALFIDGSNLYAAAKTLDFDIDYKRLLSFFANQGQLVRAFYFTALLEEQEYSSIRPLVDWLDYNGYTLVTKPAKEFTDDAGRKKIKGNMDIELAVDLMEMADSIDHAVILSGDGDFRRLIECVQRKGLRVTVLSTLRSRPPMIADELRRQADVFIELMDIREDIQRQPGEPDEILEEPGFGVEEFDPKAEIA
tara:strand:+ start:640 stop:1350 length:711 start_codon:yes stop_codon:yes gene_type:complete